MQSKIFFTGYSALKLTRLKLLVLWVGSLATRSDALSESKKRNCKMKADGKIDVQSSE